MSGERAGERVTGQVGRWVVVVAVGVTVVIALGAFWLSFAALTDLAWRSGIDRAQAWVWPVIVDGMIVAGTVAIVAMSAHPPRARRYPWAVLIGGAVVSVSANAAHAFFGDPAARHVPVWVAALVASVAPLALLVITHLTMLLTRKAAPAKPARRRRTSSTQGVDRTAAPPTSPPPAPAPAEHVAAARAAAPSIAGTPPGGSVPGLGASRAERLRLVGGLGEADEALASWVREQVARGGPVSGTAVVEAGLAGSDSTARRRLKSLRDADPEAFEPASRQGVSGKSEAPERVIDRVPVSAGERA